MLRHPETPIGQAPIPACAANCAKKTISVVDPHIIQENTWGLIWERTIDLIYGINAANVNKSANALNSDFTIIGF